MYHVFTLCAVSMIDAELFDKVVRMRCLVFRLDTPNRMDDRSISFEQYEGITNLLVVFRFSFLVSTVSVVTNFSS